MQKSYWIIHSVVVFSCKQIELIKKCIPIAQWPPFIEANTSSCFLRLQNPVNDFEQYLQANGFSQLWILSWFLRLPDIVNDLGHDLQAKGFSPVSIRSCIFILPECVNDLGQYLQTKGFSPVWIRLCSFRWPLVVNVLQFLCKCPFRCHQSRHYRRKRLCK